VGPAAGSDRQTVYVRFGRANQAVRVAFGSDSPANARDPVSLADPTQANSAIGLPAPNGFVVELGASIGMTELARRNNRNDAQRTEVIAIDQKQALPDQWYGYDGVDMLVISGATESGISGLNATTVDAIQKWVEQGGELLVCCGEQADKVFKG